MLCGPQLIGIPASAEGWGFGVAVAVAVTVGVTAGITGMRATAGAEAWPGCGAWTSVVATAGTGPAVIWASPDGGGGDGVTELVAVPRPQPAKTSAPARARATLARLR